MASRRQTLWKTKRLTSESEINQIKFRSKRNSCIINIQKSENVSDESNAKRRVTTLRLWNMSAQLLGANGTVQSLHPDFNDNCIRTRIGHSSSEHRTRMCADVRCGRVPNLADNHWFVRPCPVSAAVVLRDLVCAPGHDDWVEDRLSAYVSALLHARLHNQSAVYVTMRHWGIQKSVLDRSLAPCFCWNCYRVHAKSRDGPSVSLSLFILYFFKALLLPGYDQVQVLSSCLYWNFYLVFWAWSLFLGRPRCGLSALLRPFHSNRDVNSNCDSLWRQMPIFLLQQHAM